MTRQRINVLAGRSKLCSGISAGISSRIFSPISTPADKASD